MDGARQSVASPRAAARRNGARTGRVLSADRDPAVQGSGLDAGFRFLLVAAARARSERNRLHRVSVETGEITTVLDAEQSTDGFVSIAVSHDGSRLAIAVDITGREVISVFSLSADGVPSGTKEYRGTGSAIELQWAPDSSSVLFRRTVNTPGPLYRLTLDGDGGVSPLLWLGPGAAQPIVSARANRLVFTRTIRDANIWRVSLGSGARTIEKIAVSSFREVAPHYSPDGKRLAFHSNRSGSVQIWVSNADGSNAVQLTSMNDIATTGTPRWSPDGKRLAFDSNTSGTYQIYVINADGGQPRAVTTDASRNFTAWWSKDGNWIYYTSDRSGRLEIWRISPDGGGRNRLPGVARPAARSLPTVSGCTWSQRRCRRFVADARQRRTGDPRA